MTIPPSSETSPTREAIDTAAESLGYAPTFLGVTVDLPTMSPTLQPDIAMTTEGLSVADYTHFSLALRASRRLAAWVAWNIDGATLRDAPREGLEFRLDPRFAASAQVGNELYRNNRLDRGHIARRADLLWGSAADVDAANRDSFYYTNIAPQMDTFNQSAQAGLWGRLEDAVLSDVEVDDLAVSVFGGPVFDADDRVYRDVQIPVDFWKVITYVVDGTLRARAFLLTQNLDGLEAFDLDAFRLFQVPIAQLEDRTGVRFAPVVGEADLTEWPEASRRVESTADIRW
ncbi:DNA/RNA non-specific endonuclease [Millisia brevis]|uniref:DNA/RNA non-specific endonuclease n=1 Tax=Millisia brevis TaxID=264148 RepID=UPI000A8629CC|nr:DNA/RNA non-specific endonuclease [Millisia brevis]